jgi:hypothetical protein
MGMSFRMQSFLRQWPRPAFFALGFLTAALCGWLLDHWLEIVYGVFGMNVSYDTRPAWLRGLMIAVRWLPLGTLAALTVLRLSRGRSIRPLAFAVGAASVPVLMIGSLVLGPDIADYWHRRAFEPAEWRRNARRDTMWPTRLTMVDDLLTRHSLRGMSRDSVERLLGPRDSTAYFRDWDLVYWLGPERGSIRIDSEWLVLKLDADGRVSDCRIVRD